VEHLGQFSISTSALSGSVFGQRLHPDYARINPERARAGQRAAAVYQSDLAAHPTGAAPESLAGVRNLSGVGLVQHQSAQVFLHKDAPDRMGSAKLTDPAMRRPGTGADRDPETSRLALSDKDFLAAEAVLGRLPSRGWDALEAAGKGKSLTPKQKSLLEDPSRSVLISSEGKLNGLGQLAYDRMQARAQEARDEQRKFALKQQHVKEAMTTEQEHRLVQEATAKRAADPYYQPTLAELKAVDAVLIEQAREKMAAGLETQATSGNDRADPGFEKLDQSLAAWEQATNDKDKAAAATGWMREVERAKKQGTMQAALARTKEKLGDGEAGFMVDVSKQAERERSRGMGR